MDISNVGPKMFFILRVYGMNEAELKDEVESDRDLTRQHLMSQSEFGKRQSTRSLARRLRRHDDVLRKMMQRPGAAVAPTTH